MNVRVFDLDVAIENAYHYWNLKSLRYELSFKFEVVESVVVGATLLQSLLYYV